MTDLLAKKCTKCGEWKPTAEYGANRASPDGFRPDCRTCRAAETLKYRSGLKARKFIPTPLAKRCPCCAEEKLAAAFYAERAAKDGLSWNCRPCRSSALRKKYAEDPMYTIKNRERGRKRQRSAAEAAKNSRRGAIARMKNKIAVSMCEKLGIDLNKLAKERYDAERADK